MSSFDSSSEIIEFIFKWRKDNNVLSKDKGHKSVSMIETLATEFDVSLGQFCFDLQTNSEVACEQDHRVYVTTQHRIGETKTITEKFLMGKLAGE